MKLVRGGQGRQCLAGLSRSAAAEAVRPVVAAERRQPLAVRLHHDARAWTAPEVGCSFFFQSERHFARLAISVSEISTGFFSNISSKYLIFYLLHLSIHSEEY